MCGIAGAVDFSHQPDKRLIDKALRRINHRGPDSSGYFQDKSVCMGIRRLSIMDLESGDQPIKNEDGTVVVVFNGEIYNFAELKNQLIKKSHKFNTKSDTEVLVHLYEEFGDQMVKYLNGMFAFAIWDTKVSKLFIARDHAGIKPLYYWQKGGQLVFGSEVKTLLSYPFIKSYINTKALNLYSYLGYIPAELSIFDGIKKLLPGHSLSFSKNGIQIKQYYKLEQVTNNHNLEKLIVDSLKLQSVADVPVGVFLSGGLDSSIVTYFLSKIHPHIKTFSISFSDKSYNEGNFAKLVAKLLGTKHYEEEFKAEDIMDQFEDLISKLDEPLADPSLFPTYKVCKFARRYVKVALSGDGGDELFGGYPTYQAHYLLSMLHFLPAPIYKVPLLPLKILPTSYQNYPTKDVLTSFFLGAGKQDIQRQIFWMSLFSGGGDPGQLVRGFNYQDIKYLESWVLSQMGNNYPDKKIRMQLIDYYTYLRDNLLVKVDRASMFNSLEVRVPLLDRRIIDFAYSTSNRHYDQFTTKKLLRDILYGKLPELITKRKKKGFGIPLARWLRGSLNSFAQQHLNNPKLFEFFDKNEINIIYQAHQQGRVNNVKVIWMLVMFSAWLEKWGDIS